AGTPHGAEGGMGRPAEGGRGPASFGASDEASPHPEKAVAAAEHLRGLAPAAGHLEHMPAHILQRVGRYEEAAEANRKGAAADLAYLKETAPPDYYPMYLIHNFQFLASAAGMEGRRAETITALKEARGHIPD